MSSECMNKGGAGASRGCMNKEGVGLLCMSKEVSVLPRGCMSKKVLSLLVIVIKRRGGFWRRCFSCMSKEVWLLLVGVWVNDFVDYLWFKKIISHRPPLWRAVTTVWPAGETVRNPQLPVWWSSCVGATWFRTTGCPHLLKMFVYEFVSCTNITY